MKYYLAYGSNLNVRQMRRRCPQAVRAGASTIKDYELVFLGNSRSDVASIEPCTVGSIPIGIWEITPADERALDQYEGFVRP